MNTQNILVVAGTLVVAGLLFFTFSSDYAMKKEEMMAKEEMMKREEMVKQEMMDKEEDMMMKDEMMNKDEMMKDGEMMKKDEMMMKKTQSGMYIDYSPTKLSSSVKNVLFFKASWCPSCQAVDADINKNLSNIPANVQILKVDYDNSAELKKKYGVTYQHTFIQVDASGNMLNKWSGGSTLSQVVANIK